MRRALVLLMVVAGWRLRRAALRRRAARSPAPGPELSPPARDRRRGHRSADSRLQGCRRAPVGTFGADDGAGQDHPRASQLPAARPAGTGRLQRPAQQEGDRRDGSAGSAAWNVPPPARADARLGRARDLHVRRRAGDRGARHALLPVDRSRVRLRRAACRLPAAARDYEIGAALGTRRPSIGTATFGPSTLVWRRAGTPDQHATRMPLRQEEVRFRSVQGAWIAGTLTMPAGAGPHPAVAVVHGSGVASRSTTGPVASFFARHGFAVLAYDKRGIHQSGGRYPGELASESTIDILARDAEAAARFLAAQPGVDDARVGLWGASQAGWIMPLAASREAAIRFSSCSSHRSRRRARTACTRS